MGRLRKHGGLGGGLYGCPTGMVSCQNGGCATLGNCPEDVNPDEYIPGYNEGPNQYTGGTPSAPIDPISYRRKPSRPRRLPPKPIGASAALPGWPRPKPRPGGSVQNPNRPTQGRHRHGMPAHGHHVPYIPHKHSDTSPEGYVIHDEETYTGPQWNPGPNFGYSNPNYTKHGGEHIHPNRMIGHGSGQVTRKRSHRRRRKFDRNKRKFYSIGPQDPNAMNEVQGHGCGNGAMSCWQSGGKIMIPSCQCVGLHYQPEYS